MNNIKNLSRLMVFAVVARKGSFTQAAKELDITKENDRVVISFAYEKEIELFGPVFLLIKYAGRSK